MRVWLRLTSEIHTPNFFARLGDPWIHGKQKLFFHHKITIENLTNIYPLKNDGWKMTFHFPFLDWYLFLGEIRDVFFFGGGEGYL